jgi:hypothetical protein
LIDQEEIMLNADDNTFSHGNDLKQADAHQPPRSIVAMPSGWFLRTEVFGIRNAILNMKARR